MRRGGRFSCLPGQSAELVADVARGLDAMARVLLEATADDAGQVAGHVGAHDLLAPLRLGQR
jgi:hypothetical protein